VNNNDTPENVPRAKLLDRRAIPPMTDDIPVATDVLLHNLEPFALEAVRRAVDIRRIPRHEAQERPDGSGCETPFRDTFGVANQLGV